MGGGLINRQKRVFFCSFFSLLFFGLFPPRAKRLRLSKFSVLGEFGVVHWAIAGCCVFVCMCVCVYVFFFVIHTYLVPGTAFGGVRVSSIASRHCDRKIEMNSLLIVAGATRNKY